MQKILFTSKEQFDTYVDSETGNFGPPTGKVISLLMEPKTYPCVGIIDYNYDACGPDYIDGDFVYLEDFKPIL